MATSFQSRISSFCTLLDLVKPEQLTVQGYALEYLQLLLQHKMYYLHIYAEVLEKVLDNSAKNIGEIRLLDYGAGNGLLGLFAKHCGFGQVFLVDNNSVFLSAAEKLAGALQIRVDGFIEGDHVNILEHFKGGNKPDAIVGTDVIEHIYNLDDFFRSIHDLNSKMVTLFTTASVTSNPVKNKQLKKLQYKDECIGSNAQHAQEGDEYAGLPFVETRKRIIQKQFPLLGDKEVKQLAAATRGMRQDDILLAAELFLSSRELPAPLAHPTNTCDPISGSWTERLLSVDEYTAIYQQAGFNLRVYKGFYNEWQGGAKGIILKMLNKTIALPGRQGNLITPFITLVGKPD